MMSMHYGVLAVYSYVCWPSKTLCFRDFTHLGQDFGWNSVLILNFFWNNILIATKATSNFNNFYKIFCKL